LQPTLGAQARSQQAFLAQAESLRTHRPATGWRQRWPRILAPIAGLALFMFLFAATLIPLSARTVPGDALYSFKRLAENTRLSATTNAERKLELIEEYKETRRQEIQSLLAAGQDADDVAFEGSIETIADGVWQIAGIPVQIGADTQIEGRPEVGLAAIVTGVIRQGSLTALTILIPEGGEPVLLPNAMAHALANGRRLTHRAGYGYPQPYRHIRAEKHAQSHRDARTNQHAAAYGHARKHTYHCSAHRGGHRHGRSPARQRQRRQQQR
jgi:hypothetical protein